MMNCNKCDKEVDEELIKDFDALPPMVGYNYFPPCARCIVCKKPVCGECMRGVGMFMFVCKHPCHDKLMKKD